MRCIDHVEVGERLKRFRLDKGVKEIEVALEFAISTAQYSRLENGQGCISTDVLNRACAYYNTSVDYILFGKNQSVDSVFFQKLQNSSEEELRRTLKILTCMLTLRNRRDYIDSPWFKIFARGLLERIPLTADSAIPYVLEFERNLEKLSENAMIEKMGLTRFKWNSIMQNKKVQDVMIPLEISNQYGYDMNFLINNKIAGGTFFDELFAGETEDRQNKIMEVFDTVIDMNQGHILEKQKR